MSVWAVVAHHGDRGDTKRCLARLRASEISPDVILLVDNQGDWPREGDQSQQWAAASERGSVQVLAPGRNLGFAGAAAAGASLALKGGADWVWFVNNDAEVADDCLARLLAAGEAEARAGLLSPVIFYRDDGAVWYAGGDVSRRTLAARHRHTIAAEQPYETGYATGCAVLARSSMVRRLGPLDERLFMYAEDVDWSLRARRDGWKILVVPAARVVHGVARAAGRRRFSPLAVYLLTRNHLALARRWDAGPAAVPATLWWGTRQLLKSRTRAELQRQAMAVACGLCHGLTGRLGPPPPLIARPRR